MNVLQSFIKDSIFYIIPSILSRGIGFFLLPLYTRILSPADYGAFDLFMVAGSLVSLTIALEVSQGLARHYPDAKKEGQGAVFASTGLSFTVICYAIALLVAFPFADSLSYHLTGKDTYAAEFRLALIYFLANGIYLYLQSYLRWDLQSKQFAISSIIVTLVTALTAVFLAGVQGMGLLGILWALIIGTGLGSTYAAFIMKDSLRFQMDVSKLIEMLRFSIPLVPSGILVFVTYYIDRLMINHYLGLEETGIYAVAFRIATVISILAAAIQGAITPLIFNNYKNPKTPEQISIIFQLFLSVSLVAWLGISLFANEILLVMTTQSFYGAAPLVAILAPSLIISSMYVFAPGISIAKKTHIIIWINLAAAIINIALNMAFIPWLGIYGAAVATLIANLSAFILYIVISHKYYPIPHEWIKIIILVILFLVIIVFTTTIFPQQISWAIILLKIAIIVIGTGLLAWAKLLNFSRFMDLMSAKPDATEKV
jgi:O-antigen/teichoic acid export membrane protein